MGAANCGNDFRLVNGNMRHNWRTGKSIQNTTAPDFDKAWLAAYSTIDENTPIAYRSEQPQRMLAINYPRLYALTPVFFCI